MAAGSRLKFTGTFFVFPLLQGCESPQGVQENVQDNPRVQVNIAGEAELTARGAGVMASLLFLLLELSGSPAAAPAPDQAPPSVSHLLLYKSYSTAQSSKIWNKK